MEKRVIDAFAPLWLLVGGGGGGGASTTHTSSSSSLHDSVVVGSLCAEEKEDGRWEAAVSKSARHVLHERCEVVVEVVEVEGGGVGDRGGGSWIGTLSFSGAGRCDAASARPTSAAAASASTASANAAPFCAKRCSIITFLLSCCSLIAWAPYEMTEHERPTAFAVPSIMYLFRG